MEYEYFVTHQANGLLDIEDIGNCSIDIFNDEGKEMILVIDTQLGSTRVFTFGPFNPEFEKLPNNVACNLQQMPFSQQKISKIIRQFLNNYQFGATQAFEIEKEEALGKCRDLIGYMKLPIY